MLSQDLSATPVLLVEDSVDDERLAVRVFESLGLPHPLIVARDGIEAIEALEECKRTDQIPALMLLDLKLPKVNGLEVLERVRADERMRFVPVVILTTSDENGDILRSYEKGANGYVRKPMAFSDYKDSFTKMLQFWLAVNLRPSESARHRG